MSTQNLERKALLELLPDVIYEVGGTQCAVSPDGVGLYWYDTEEALREDYLSEILAHVEVTDDELEEIRNGE